MVHRSIAVATALALTALACSSNHDDRAAAAPPTATATAPKPESKPESPPAVKPAAPAEPAAERCEVEMFGTVKGGPADKPVVVYVAIGDCLADDARVLGVARKAQAGGYMIEVFADWGTALSVCAAIDEGPGKPTTWYGKAPGERIAEGEGEVVFNDVVVELKQGAPHVFPAAAR